MQCPTNPCLNNKPWHRTKIIEKIKTKTLKIIFYYFKRVNEKILLNKHIKILLKRCKIK